MSAGDTVLFILFIIGELLLGSIVYGLLMSVIEAISNTGSEETTPRHAQTAASGRTVTKATVDQPVPRIIKPGGHGPNGVSPLEFPCCPYDKQRNLPEHKQLIYWDSMENCYWCSRGHKFKSNGKPF